MVSPVMFPTLTPPPVLVGLTVSVVYAVASMPSALVYVATMIEVPALVVVENPVLATIVATPVLLEVQVDTDVRFSVAPVPVVPITTNPTVAPAVTTGLAGTI